MLTFTSRPSCTQVIDDFDGRLLARPAVKVHEVTGIASAAAAGALQARGLHGAAEGRLCGPLRLCCHVRARTARAERHLSEHARPTPSRARHQYRDPHILGALVHAVSTVPHLYVTGGLCHVQ